MNNLNAIEPLYYTPGDIVTVRHDIPNKMIGWIVEKVNRNIRTVDGESSSMFVGMKVRWFDNNGDLQEAIFSTKDLQLID
ncbi:MAG: hypothetical protein J6X03_02070 [Bacilli bacterium]|nr:hypothetical protein [Bacilli bacterium]